MTRPTSARVAGFTFLLYIATGLAGMSGLVSRLGASVVLSLVMCFSALVLGVALYRVTCDEDRELAMFGLVCRTGEGVLGAVFLPLRLALVTLGTAVAASAADGETARALVAIVGSARRWNTIVGATFFAAGSLAFCWLLLRGRMIPSVLGWLGVFASVLLVVGLPLQLAQVLVGRAAMAMWLPMAAFEIPAGVWLLVKGVPPSSREVA